MSRLISSLLGVWRHPRLREIFLWSLPALVLALVLRVMLCVALPYAYYHDDGPDFFRTPDRLISEHKWQLHEKKTFLVPFLFSVPFAIPAPVLVTIPIFQHLLGLGLIFLIGALCRFWFTQWKWFIVPITTLAAINPFYLWFEHTTMAETTFVFCTVLLALAGTLYVRRPSLNRFIFLCVTLVLEAGARPEGKLLFGFGVFLLVLVHWKSIRKEWMRPAILAGVGLVTHFFTTTSQAGLLLYTSVARLTPQRLSVAPGFDPYIADIRANLQRRWNIRPQFPNVRDRKAISAAVGSYLKDQDAAGAHHVHNTVNAYCLKLAKETCLRNLAALPEFALVKFRLVAVESPAGAFDNYVLFKKQRIAVFDDAERFIRMGPRLTGRKINSEEELNHFIDTNYHEVRWFNRLNERWLKVVNTIHLPNQSFPNPANPKSPSIYHGIPIYFIAAAAGLVAIMFRPGELRRFHIAWGLAMLGFFFTIMLTANVRPRFRFVFEPFWFIYIALLGEMLWSGVRRFLGTGMPPQRVDRGPETVGSHP